MALAALGPAGLALARQDRFQAAIEVSEIRVGRTTLLIRPSDLKTYAGDLLDTEFVAGTLARSVDYPLDPGDVSSKLDVVPTGSATSVLPSHREGTPGRARAIAGVLGPIVQAQAAIDQRGRIGRRLRRLRLRAESPDASRRENGPRSRAARGRCAGCAGRTPPACR